MNIQDYLQEHGPTTAAVIGTWLQENGLKAEAARKRLSRAQAPICSFPVPLFPKRTRFLYLKSQYKRPLHNPDELSKYKAGALTQPAEFTGV
ncbi:MAG: hypothetical protein QM520_05880 [Gammaproteobacteria bacterium]|nr:hypothetical protein [Gammaproteobacteria bacterium]